MPVPDGVPIVGRGENLSPVPENSPPVLQPLSRLFAP